MTSNPTSTARAHDPLVRARRWATTFETAEYIGCGERTVRRMIAAGLLPAYRVNARLIRIDLNEADDAIGTRCLPSGSTAVRGEM